MEINKLYNENCLDTLGRMPDKFVDLVVTSPPYDDLRTYNGYSFPFEDIAKGLYRITKQGGVIVWVVGDATVKGSESGTSFRQALYFKEIGFNLHDTMMYRKINYIPLTHNNALDFIGVTAELYLPFYTGSINIDPNILIGKQVKIVCEIVVNTGDTTINIYDNDANTIVDIVKTMIGGDFPLFNAVNQDLLQFTPQQALNPIRQAYIIISRPNYSQNTPKAQRTGTLVGVKGEVTIQDIDLITNAYADEKLMIENLISQGVIIK